MKFIPFLLPLFIFNVNATELIKEELCTKVSQGYHYRIDKKDCLNDGHFSILSTQDIYYNNKTYALEMDIEIIIKGSLFNVKAARTFSPSPLKLGAWDYLITSYKLSTYHKVFKASIHDDNVEEITNNNELLSLPQNVLAFVGDEEYSQAEDYLSEISFFKIFDNKKLIGFIGHQWFESESQDIKGFSEQSFDLRGNLVGNLHVESFGYHE